MCFFELKTFLSNNIAIERQTSRLVVSTHLKNMLVKLDHFPRDRGEHKKIFQTTSQEGNEHVSGQISIIPKPELRGFWGSSLIILIKPPFRVTSADVAIICPDVSNSPKRRQQKHPTLAAPQSLEAEPLHTRWAPC